MTHPTSTLLYQEAILAAYIGVHRHMRGLKNDRSEPHGSPSDPWETAIGGAQGENAVAKYLGAYWSDSPRLDYDGDVGTYQVRWTKHSHGHMPLYDRDADHQNFVMVTGGPLIFQIPGWIVARDGKIEEYREIGRTLGFRDNAYTVPQYALLPIETLPR